MTRCRLYGVFNPSGDLIAAFRSSAAADAMASYKFDALHEAIYWSMAPQPPTIALVVVDAEPPAQTHHIGEAKGRNYAYCNHSTCPRHGRDVQRNEVGN